MIVTQIEVSGLNSNRRMVVGAFSRVRVATQCLEKTEQSWKTRSKALGTTMKATEKCFP